MIKREEMIEINIWKILLVLIVALIVLGPEHLQKGARFLGRILGRCRQIVNTLQKDFHKIAIDSEKDRTSQIHRKER